MEEFPLAFSLRVGLLATNSENANQIIDDNGNVKKKKASEQFQFEVDENGEININTKDVEIIGEETAKIYDEKQKQTYSVKKARGDYREPKIKWWEIYKWADRSFARRKIKREVSKFLDDAVRKNPKLKYII